MTENKLANAISLCEKLCRCNANVLLHWASYRCRRVAMVVGTKLPRFEINMHFSRRMRFSKPHTHPSAGDLDAIDALLSNSAGLNIDCKVCTCVLSRPHVVSNKVCGMHSLFGQTLY